MAGMKFLNLKGWHPSNARNQKRIWIAEQKAQQHAQAERDAAAEVRKHAEAQQFQALAAARGDAESARRSEQLQVGFLYAPPPGLEKVDDKVEHAMTEDDAVREFRRKMEKRTAPASADDVQRPLERYVGRRPDEMLTIKEQVERFPFLKDAPVEGDYASNVKVNFKPMGRTLRNVKCMRCGEWGHQSGDRECALRDANPHDASRLAREDPMAIVAQLKQQGQLVLRQRALPLEMQAAQANGDPEYEILLSDDDSGDAEKAFLAGLSTKEKKALLKKLRKQSKKESRRDDGASSDGSSSSSDSHEDRSSRKRKRKHAKKPKHEEKPRGRSHRRHEDSTEDERASREKRRSRQHRSRSRSRSRSRTREQDSHPHKTEKEYRRNRSRSRSPRRHRRH